MTRSENDLLRATVRSLADESGTPSDLAVGAMAQGRRIRRNRRAATVVAALAVLVAAGTPFVTFRDPGTTVPDPAATRPVVVTPSPTTLTPSAFVKSEVFRGPGGARLLGFHEDTTNFVLDPATGGYRELTEPDAVSDPSPNERHVMIYLTTNRTVILDLKSGTTRKLPFPTPLDAVWSADGSRLLVSHEDGFSVVDAATGRTVKHTVSAGHRLCMEYCRFTWLAGETEVALPQASARNSEMSQINGLAIFDAGTGELLRQDPIKGAPIGRHPWSADGRLVLIQATPLFGDKVSIVEVGSRRQIREFGADWATFLADGTVLSRTGNTLHRYGTDGTRLEVMELPRSLHGRGLQFGR